MKVIADGVTGKSLHVYAWKIYNQSLCNYNDIKRLRAIAHWEWAFISFPPLRHDNKIDKQQLYNMLLKLLWT